MRLAALGAIVAAIIVLPGVACGSSKTVPFAKLVQVAPHVRLFVHCTGSGPTVLADSQLGTPYESWNAVRRSVHGLRFCAFDRAGVGRSDLRSCRCGTIEQNVRDIHALVSAAHLKTPLVLAGASTGGLDALLYARRYRDDLSGLVLVDSPSESAPPPPAPLDDGATQLDFRTGVRALRSSPGLGDLPLVVLSHGKGAFSTAAAERSWQRMQRQLARDSSDALPIVALHSGHLIQVDQPELVAVALEEASGGKGLHCTAALTKQGGHCGATEPSSP